MRHTFRDISSTLYSLPGKRRTSVRLPRGSLIIVDYHGDRLGGPDTVLGAGHRYVVAVESNVADEVMNLFRG